MSELDSANSDLYLRPTAVYRLFDAIGSRLYVGVAWDLEARWAQHEREKGWWPLVAEKRVVWFENRFLALAEETRAIEAEKPVHNVVGMPAAAAVHQSRARGTMPRINSDRHRGTVGVLGRPNPELREEAIAMLAARDWTMNEFLVAVMAELAASPDPGAILAEYAEFKPPRRKGRPPSKKT